MFKKFVKLCKNKKYVIFGLLIIYSVYFLYSSNYRLDFFSQQDNIRKQALPDSYKYIGDRIQQRVERVRSACSNMSNNNKFKFADFKLNRRPWMFVSHKYKLIYCQIPKVGSTNWLRLFGIWQGLSKMNLTRSVHSMPISAVHLVARHAREKVFRTYRKFMVIRDPFDRVISAFRDKFEKKKGRPYPMFHFLSKHIIRANHGIAYPLRGKFANFEEFIAFILNRTDEYPMHYSQPRHWIPQSDLCYPCNVDYDLIFDLNSINEEANYMMKLSNIPPKFQYPPIKNVIDYDKLKMKYLSKVRPEYLRALYQYYENDYKIFSFKHPL